MGAMETFFTRMIAQIELQKNTRLSRWARTGEFAIDNPNMGATCCVSLCRNSFDQILHVLVVKNRTNAASRLRTGCGSNQ